MRTRSFLGAAAFAALVAAPILGSPALAAPSLLAPEQYDPARLLPPPPADGSDIAKAELAELHRIETARTSAQFAKAKKDGETKNAGIFAEAVPGFDLDALPVTAKLFSHLRKEEEAAVTVAKNYFHRNRPYAVDTTLHTCSKNEDPRTSYPSGHSTMAYSMGVVLAALMPEKAQDILRRSADYAESRLICGVHYRRDIVAGEAYGTVIAIELMANPAFKAEMAAAAQELHDHHVGGAP